MPAPSYIMPKIRSRSRKTSVMQMPIVYAKQLCKEDDMERRTRAGTGNKNHKC